MFYVNHMIPTQRSQKWPFSAACHLYADSETELHAVARRLGLRRSWFQDRNGFPHYDLVKARRAHALRLGAIEHSRRELVEWVRQRRKVASDER